MLPTFTEMLRSLVGTPSISSLNPALDRSNRGVLDHLANWLEDLDFRVEIQSIANSNGKCNLIAQKGSGEGGVLLAGHTDTVACDEHLWSYDPFDLSETSDKYYGLGSCDMKGFFPTALSAISSFDEKSLSSPVSVLATCDEETTMLGARHLSKNNELTSEVAIIGEPTSMAPVYAHKGIFVLKIQTEGKAAHSSNPALGVNALEGMHAILTDLIEFREELKTSYNHKEFEVCFPTLNLGCLHAGDSANRICSHADLLIDIRLVPGMSSDDIFQQLERRLRLLERRIEMPVTIDMGFPPIEPFATSRDSRLVKLLQKNTGHAAKTVAFGTEAPFLQGMGLETVVFGPGSIDQAHQVDEYLRKDQIDGTRKALEVVISDYCT